MEPFLMTELVLMTEPVLMVEMGTEELVELILTVPIPKVLKNVNDTKTKVDVTKVMLSSTKLTEDARNLVGYALCAPMARRQKNVINIRQRGDVILDTLNTPKP